jgi:hypothetical protein
VRDKVFASSGVTAQSDPQALRWMDLVDGDPGTLEGDGVAAS